MKWWMVLALLSAMDGWMEDAARADDEPLFVSAINVPTGVPSRHYALFDVNGDGATDVVAARGSEVGVALRDEGIVFADPVVSQTGFDGFLTMDPIVGDLTGDGAGDLVLSLESYANGDETVGVLVNTGGGAFEPVTLLDVFRVDSAAIIDLDGDGDLDVLIEDFDEMLQLLNDGSGLLTPAGAHPDIPLMELEAVADFDGNGIDDLLAELGPQAVWLAGDGDGGFSSPTPFFDDGITGSPSIWDADGDGDTDVVVNISLDVTTTLSFLNDGKGHFSVGWSEPESGPVWPWAGDVNGDGLDDLVGQTIRLNNGANGLLPEKEYYSEINELWFTSPAKLDQQGNVGVLVRDYNSCSRATITLSRGDGSFTEAKPAGISLSNTLALTSADLDGNDLPDLVGVASPVLVLLRNTGSLSFELVDSFEIGGFLQSVAFTDVTGDDVPDITVVSEQYGLSVLPGKGGFDFGEPILVELAEQSISHSLADLDGDGDLDIATTNFLTSAKSIELVWNLGGAMFSEATSIATDSRTWDVEATDVDADGDADLVSSRFEGGLAIYYNDGAGNFGPPVAFACCEDSRNLAVGDIDGDGDKDILLTNREGVPADLVVFLNDGAGTFMEGAAYSPVGHSYSSQCGDWAGAREVSLTDLDADGDLDVALGHESFSSVSILLNDGNGQFTEVGVFYTTDGRPWSIAPEDYDGDGDRDLAVGHNGSDLPKRIMLLESTLAEACAADVNGDGMLNIFDFVALQAASLNGDATADCNGDGLLDVFDFVCFQAVFANGCPE